MSEINKVINTNIINRYIAQFSGPFFKDKKIMSNYPIPCWKYININKDDYIIKEIDNTENITKYGVRNTIYSIDVNSILKEIDPLLNNSFEFKIEFTPKTKLDSFKINYSYSENYDEEWLTNLNMNEYNSSDSFLITDSYIKDDNKKLFICLTLYNSIDENNIDWNGYISYCLIGDNIINKPNITNSSGVLLDYKIRKLGIYSTATNNINTDDNIINEEENGKSFKIFKSDSDGGTEIYISPITGIYEINNIDIKDFCFCQDMDEETVVNILIQRA